MFGRRRKSGCERIREMLSPYIDGRLTTVDRDAVLFHIEVCQSCRYELKTLEVTRQLLQRLPVVPVPRSFTLGEAPEGARVFQSWYSHLNVGWMKLAAAAAVIVLVVSVTLDFAGIVSPGSSGSAEGTGDTVLSAELLDEALPSPDESTPSSGIPEAPFPDPSASTGVAESVSESMVAIQVDETQMPALPEAEQLTDPRNGEGEVLSPTPPPHSPLWVRVLEIIAGASLIVFGSLYLVIRRDNRSRVISSTRG